MSESGGSGSRRGRGHDAKGAREAILNAAESSYNKSLLFQYFGDKLYLYTEVIRRADLEMNEVQAALLAPLLTDETITSNAYKFKALLETIATAIFDYLAEHPRLVRII